MKKGSYHLNWIYRDVAAQLRAAHNYHPDAPTVWMMVNDALDYWGKAGFQVNHDYNQDSAVDNVRRELQDL